MSLILNNKNISKVYLGETPISKIYRGETLVYQLNNEKIKLTFASDVTSGTDLFTYNGASYSAKQDYKIGDELIIKDLPNGITSLSFNEKNYYSAIEFLPKLDTSKVTDMDYMFYGCSSLASLDVSNFNTSNVTNMGFMFYGCSSLTSLDVSNFDTSKVINMARMFYTCPKLTSLDLSNFNTSSVTFMNNMFHGCSSLTSLDLSNFDTSNVTIMRTMFYGCTSLTSLDVSNFDTSNVTNMNGMFSSCPSLTSLDVSNFDTSNVTDMNGMFRNCKKLNNIIFGSSWGKNSAALYLDLNATNGDNNYQFTDDTWSSMLTMYDRAANGLTNAMTLRFSSSSNFPNGWVETMTAKGYTITN